VDWLLLPPAALIGAEIAVSFGAWRVLAADRGEPVRAGAHEIATIVREGCLRSLFRVISPLGWGWVGPDTAPGTRLPVLFVPGHRWNRSAFWWLGLFLQNRGWGVTWAVNHRAGDWGVSELAEDLGRQIELLCKATGSERIDVVGHGMGGVVAAWYARHLDGARRVRKLVTLGTPWGGTRQAVFLGGRKAEELRLQNPLLSTLSPPAVPTVAVWSPDDSFVIPSASAVPQGAESVRIEGAAHADLLVSAKAFRAVQAALETP
jgi:triacylglycerol esterase/lipase EstA (alpha/beta hydrolase family)